MERLPLPCPVCLKSSQNCWRGDPGWVCVCEVVLPQFLCLWMKFIISCVLDLSSESSEFQVFRECSFGNSSLQPPFPYSFSLIIPCRDSVYVPYCLSTVFIKPQLVSFCLLSTETYAARSSSHWVFADIEFSQCDYTVIYSRKLSY